MTSEKDIIGVAKTIAQNSKYPWRDVQIIAEALLIAVEALEDGSEYEKTWVIETEDQKPCTKALSRIRSL